MNFFITTGPFGAGNFTTLLFLQFSSDLSQTYEDLGSHGGIQAISVVKIFKTLFLPHFSSNFNQILRKYGNQGGYRLYFFDDLPNVINFMAL